MRKWIRIVEASSGNSGDPIGSPEWRKSVLEMARDEDDSTFSVIRPFSSGINRSIYLSGWDKCPAIIVDSRMGNNVEPDIESSVYVIDEQTKYPEVNEWLSNNIDLVKRHQKQEISTIDVINNMVVLNEGKLLEMANWPRGRFNNPLAFFIRPEPNPLPHNARVKVNKNYRLGFSNGDCFSVALFPRVKVVEGHDTGEASKSDVNGMVLWISKNKNAFYDYYQSVISDKDLDIILKNNPYS